MKLIDSYNRNLNYLRVSITDRCNLNCMYCVPNRFKPKLSHEEILRYEEILRVINICSELGISKVRVTGGEPLVRKGVYSFLKQLTEVDGISDFSLTTNGVLLRENIDRIKTAGIKRINISLDTINREKYEKITGHNLFDQTWNGVLKALEAGFAPIKLNAVVLSEINDNELLELARLSFSYPFHIRFIEYMPIGNPRMNYCRHMLAPEIKKLLGELGELIPLESGKVDGPSQRYKFEGAKGEVGIISPISQHFCDKCNRLRLTADGQLRVCLLSDFQEDLKGPLRSGVSDREIADIILKAVQAKPGKHKVSQKSSKSVSTQMTSIGG